MKTRTLLAALLVAILGAAVVAQPASSDKKPPAGPAPEQLVEQLGDPDYRKRDQAFDLLKQEGVKALPVLRASLKHPDAEVRRRLIELIPAIETAATLAPKRVTLKMKNKTLKELFDELTKQTGYHYEYYHNDPNAKFSFEFNNLTFWEVIDQIVQTTGLDLQQGYGDDRVRLQYRGEGAAPYSLHDGSFRFTATNFQLYRTVDLMQPGRGAHQRSESLTFCFAVQSEPKLPILGIGQPHVTAAFDSDKNSMLIPSNPGEFIDFEGRSGRYTSRYGNGNRVWYMQTQLNLHRSSEKTTAVKVLRGTLPVTLLAEQKPHVISADLLKGKGAKVTIGTTTIHVEEVIPVANTDQVTVRISFTEDTGGNQNDYSWQNSIYQRVEVQDAKGVKYQIYGQNWGANNGNSMQITYTYAPPEPKAVPAGPNQKKPAPPELKLVFYEWKVLEHRLNFEFKDLPLP